MCKRINEQQTKFSRIFIATYTPKPFICKLNTCKADRLELPLIHERSLSFVYNITICGHRVELLWSLCVYFKAVSRYSDSYLRPGHRYSLMDRAGGGGGGTLIFSWYEILGQSSCNDQPQTKENGEFEATQKIFQILSSPKNMPHCVPWP